MNRVRSRVVAAAAAALVGLASAGAAFAQADLSGFWELRGLQPPPAPKAQLTPQAVKTQADMQAAAAKTSIDGVSFSSRWCLRLGMPFMMSVSPPLHFVQNKDVLMITQELNTTPREIYLDRTAFPDEDSFDPTSNGFSIGHFEGDTLVVETRYFATDRGLPWINGGGYKTSKTRLIERMNLIEDGKALKVHNTWIDPDVFATPQEYDVTYFRSEPGTYALEYWCDASEFQRYREEHPALQQDPKPAAEPPARPAAKK